MSISVVDPFGLPAWLGTHAVTWCSVDPLGDAAFVRGCLRADAHGDLEFDLDLIAVDAAYPASVCPQVDRRAAHQAWRFGEVMLLEVGGRVAAGVPVSSFDANLACETLRRVAKSVGAESKSFTVAITLARSR